MATSGNRRNTALKERKMNHQDVLERLAELFVGRGVPEYLRSDNGSEFTARVTCPH